VDTVSGLPQVLETLSGVISPEIQNSLVSKVEAAAQSSDAEKINAAVNQLNAFINEVEAQRGKKISDEAADLLINYALNAARGLMAQ
jgi:ABC-type transporter Mla subunit MlaD